ncbi:MAG TPA: Type 1 glutamine amidotransferase-like domain-containing protein [Candidatus Dormibacteraeota bacterium]|nr:Type 1 glutamine amidotransferase-like domain-containing protein [Candidatus Dormibacteraeota bacterium]
MRDRHLFLFGGSPPFSKNLGKKFSDLSLNGKGKIAILFIIRDGWKEYMQKYTSVLEENDLKQFSYIALSSSPDHATIKELKTCTGIIISGGETELYRKFIVDTAIGEQVIQMYHDGVPVAGFSAGALISPESCVISPVDNVKKEHLFLKGLGLISDCVISVHFSKWNEEENLKLAMKKVNAPIGYGIDDEGYLFLKNERLIENESESFCIFEKEILY